MKNYPTIPHHFLIVAPPYQVRSGGVMVLHDLCDAINRCGHRASIAFIHDGSADKQDFKYAYSNNEGLYHPEGRYFKLDLSNIDGQIADILDAGTVIYPDLISGNPLGARRVIRFILNKNTDSHGGEYVLAFSEVYCDYYNFALPKMFLDSNINADGALHWSKRSLNLTYIGKGQGFENCFRIPGSILVERDWPRDKEQLGLLLRQCKFFFTWDCVSATNYDAALCGAVPILLHDKQIPREKINRMEFGGFPVVEFRFNDFGEVVVGDIDAAVEKIIDASLDDMMCNIARLESSWQARVGQFLNNYILFMCAQ